MKEHSEKIIDQYKGLVYPYIGSSMLTNNAEQRTIMTNAKLASSIDCTNSINALKECLAEMQEELKDQISDKVSSILQNNIDYYENLLKHIEATPLPEFKFI